MEIVTLDYEFSMACFMMDIICNAVLPYIYNERPVGIVIKFNFCFFTSLCHSLYI
jgi:hypothetical protein